MADDLACSASDTIGFPPTLAAALSRLQAVRPSDYARTRNALDGAVTRLSPYLSHGLLSLPQAHAAISARHPLDPQHKLVYEFGWREYSHHAWAHRGAAILASLHPGPLPEHAYADTLPADIREGRTGVPAIDCAVRELYASGYLHNHARMWLASYVVHLRKVHWRAGADWLYAHLLDGDLASNHLGWQWVAGTASYKPYLFNAQNVAKYAPPPWHSPGTAIDRSYEALDGIARNPHAGESPDRATAAVVEPLLHAGPPEGTGFSPPDPALVAGRHVWLVHPWALRAPPADMPGNTLILALGIGEWHRAWPWSARRWQFVEGGMRALASHAWFADVATLRAALADAQSVQATDDAHLGNLLGRLHAGIRLRPVPRLFTPVEPACDSFTQWWQRTRLA